MTSDSLVRVLTGKLGSGKTWVGVMEAMDALMRGEVVVSNVRFEWAAVEAYCKPCSIPRENYRFFDTQEVAESPDKLLELLTQGSMLLFDEVHLVLDSRNWQANKEKAGAFQTLLTQARKLRLDMWFISQSEANVDTRIVRQATHIVRVANWLHFPIVGTLFPLPLTIVRTCAPDGRTVLARRILFRRSNVGRLYNSHQTFCGIELTGKAAGKVLGKKRRKLSYGSVLMAAGFCCLVAGAFFNGPGKPPAKPVEASQAAKPAERPKPARIAPAVAAASPQGPPAGGAEPARWAQVDVNAFELTLPAIHRVTPFAIWCMNGLKIEPGVALGLGTVKGWGVYPGHVKVFLDSPEMPEIRLYHHGRKPYLVSSGRDARGGGARLPLRDVSAHLELLSEPVPQRVDPPASPALPDIPVPVPPASMLGPAYVAPLPFIPQ